MRFSNPWRTFWENHSHSVSRIDEISTRTTTPWATLTKRGLRGAAKLLGGQYLSTAEFYAPELPAAATCERLLFHRSFSSLVEE